MLIRELAPDLVFLHGQVVVNDSALPQAEALACKDGRIVAVGSDEEITPLIGEHTRVVDLAGRTLLPGIVDAHNHLLEVGLKDLFEISLEEVRSIAEMVELVRQRAAETPPGQWIVGTGWNESLFAEGRLPTRHDLDAATTQHPVLLKRFFNMDVVNTVALEKSGVDAQTPDPPAGKIERDEEGVPNGLFRAAAKQLVRCLLPPPTPAQMEQAIIAAGRAYLQVGITSVIEPGLTPEQIRAFQRVYQRGELPLRVNVMPSWHGFLDTENAADLEQRATQLGLFSGMGNEWFRLGALKMALDGGTTSRTAYMYEPFCGESRVINYNRLDTASLVHYFRQAHELHWDIGIHCCGDRAQDMAVEALAQVVQASSRSDARHQIIHAYFPTTKSLALMGEFSLGAVIQPTFIYFEGDDLFRDVGPSRAANYKPARKYLEAHIPLAASSDVASTVSYNPFIGLYALVTRKSWLHTPIAPDQALTRQEALTAYTRGGAWFTREEKEKGALLPGMLADCIVIDRDYFRVPEEEITSIRVEMTVLHGEIVYQADPKASP